MKMQDDDEEGRQMVEMKREDDFRDKSGAARASHVKRTSEEKK